AGRFTPLESTRDYKNPTAIQKVELQSMISPRVLVNAVGGYSGYVTDYDAARSFARADAPPRQDLATTLNTGSASLHQNKTRDRVGYRRQVRRESDVRPVQLHAGGHVCRLLQPERHRERHLQLARSERRQAV